MGLSDLDYPEVEYRHTGLVSVVCQLRFNPILKIAVQPPAEFQDLIRTSYPKVIGEQALAEVSLTIGRPQEAPEIIPSVQNVPIIWRFKSEDEQWTASLALDFISLETTRYRHFPDFLQRFAPVIDALEEVYRIDSFVRVGLRYINLFTEHDFPDHWVRRFNPRLLGVMADETIGDEVDEMRQTFVLSNGDWRIAVRHGTDDEGYRLDIDHFTDSPIKPNDVVPRLEEFNGRAYQLFRWSISDDMDKEMEAKPLD